MTLKELSSNLQEIYSAGHTQDDLIADLTGKYIYTKSSGWGRVWSNIQTEGLKKRCLEQAMGNTHRLFKKHLSEVNSACQSYETNLKKRYFGETISAGDMAKDRQILCRWHSAVAPYIQYAKSGQSAAVRRAISIGFSENYSKDYKDPLSEGSFSELIRRQRRIVKLEGILKTTLPVNLLIKVSKNETLNQPEQLAFKKFVQKLNKNHHFVDVRHLHNALQSVIYKANEFASAGRGAAPNVSVLELAMINLDCKILLKRDPKYIAQRNFKPSEKVVVNERELLIGERLGSANENDQNVVYTTDDPNVVLSIGINTVVHPLKRLLTEKSWGIEPVKYVDVDKKTGYALIERLYDHLGSFKWASHSDIIDPTDEDVAAPLWQLFKMVFGQKVHAVKFFIQIFNVR